LGFMIYNQWCKVISTLDNLAPFSFSPG